MDTKVQTIPITATPELIKKGWNILVQQLGINQATRFVVALERGEGDTILDVERYWGNASVQDIHKQIMDAKAKGELVL